MIRETIQLLVVGDSEVECKTDQDLRKLNIGSLGFLPKDLDRYDMIVYQGSRGSKILKSKYTKGGIIRKE